MSDEQHETPRPSFSSGSFPGRTEQAPQASPVPTAPVATQVDGESPAPAAPAAPVEAPRQAQPDGQKTNTLAIVSLISAFFVSLVAVITGHIALKQIKTRGGKGRGLALWGTILGYVGLASQVVAVVLVMTLGLAAFGPASQDPSDLTPKQQEIAEQQDAAGGSATPSEGAPEGDEAVEGGIQGHTVSAEFCKAYEEAVAVSEALSAEGEGLTPGQPLPDVLLASYESLAKQDSPNQAVYQTFYEFAKDPTSVTDTDQLGKMLDDFASAAASDEVACAAL